MNRKLKELYYHETEHGCLQFESSLEYRHDLAQAEALYPDHQLPAAVFRLLDTANRISFAHGFRLDLRLARWARRTP